MNRVREFHLAACQPVDVEFDYEVFDFRKKLIDEECDELKEAIDLARF